MAEFTWTLNAPALGDARPTVLSPRARGGDVRLFHTNDGGEVEWINGQPTVDSGLETAAYLSMFGGNERDSGRQGDDRLQWWGNLSEQDLSRRYRSETQWLLRSIPATTANLRRVEDAANRDLEWMLESIADAITVVVTMPGLNRVGIAIAVELDGRVIDFDFNQPWLQQQAA